MQFLQEVPFMGHVLTYTPHGVKTDPEEAKAVQDMPKPEDVEGTQRKVEKFLPGLADVIEPLRRLTRRDTEWQWTEEENSFKEVKKVVSY